MVGRFCFHIYLMPFAVESFPAGAIFAKKNRVIFFVPVISSFFATRVRFGQFSTYVIVLKKKCPFTPFFWYYFSGKRIYIQLLNSSLLLFLLVFFLRVFGQQTLSLRRKYVGEYSISKIPQKNETSPTLSLYIVLTWNNIPLCVYV